mgnify:CR=1 FL=1
MLPVEEVAAEPAIGPRYANNRPKRASPNRYPGARGEKPDWNTRPPPRFNPTKFVVATPPAASNVAPAIPVRIQESKTGYLLLMSQPISPVMSIS